MYGGSVFCQALRVAGGRHVMKQPNKSKMKILLIVSMVFEPDHGGFEKSVQDVYNW